MTKVQSYQAKQLGKDPGLKTLVFLRHSTAMSLKRMDTLYS